MVMKPTKPTAPPKASGPTNRSPSVPSSGKISQYPDRTQGAEKYAQQADMATEHPMSVPLAKETEVGFKSGRYTPNRMSNVGYEIAVNGMLASPHTTLLNLASNTFTALAAPIDTSYKVLTSRFSAPEHRTSVKAALASAQGMAYGMVQGIKYLSGRVKSHVPGQAETAGATLKKLNLSSGLDATNRLELQNQTVSSTGLGLDPKSIPGKISDTLGAVINVPGTVLNGSDMMFKIMHAERVRYEWAADMVSSGGARNMNAALQKLIDDPALNKEVVSQAEFYTYMGRPNSPVLSWVTDTAMDKLPGLRWVIPFKRSIANILEQTIERSPLVIFNPTLAKRLGSKDPAIRNTAQARLLTGVTLTATLGLAFQDNITGVAPKTAKEADLWRNVNGPEDSIVFKNSTMGDMTIKMDSLGVYGQFLKIISRYQQWNSNMDREMLFKQPGRDQTHEVLKQFGKFVAPITDTLADSFWGSNVMEFSGIMTKAIEQNDPIQLMRWLEGMGVKLIPVKGSGAARWVAQLSDPYSHKAQDFGDKLRMQSAELSKTIRYNWSWDGKKMLSAKFKGAGSRQFARYEYNPNTPMETQISDLGVSIPENTDYVVTPSYPGPQQGMSFPGTKVYMSDEEWDTINQWHDTGVPDTDIPGIREYLKLSTFDSSGFKSLTKDFKRKAIEVRISEYRQMLRAHFLAKNVGGITDRMQKIYQEEFEKRQAANAQGAQ